MQMPNAMAPVRWRPIGNEERLSVVGHLDELRTRLIISLLTLAVAFGICFWQNTKVLRLIDRPLAHQTQQQVRAGHGPLGATYKVQRSARDIAAQLDTVVGLLGTQSRQPAVTASLAQVQHNLAHDVSQLSAAPTGDRPVTLGIGEPFTTTVTVTAILALVLSLPLILLQVYGFLMPAFEPEQRRRMLPVTLAIPVLFAAGVVFGYAVVLPSALHFFQNFNSSEFNVLVQASPVLQVRRDATLSAMGLLFQVPVAIFAVTRAGIVTPRQLRSKRRYAILACGLVAAVLPASAVTMLLETVPLYLLFEASVMLASISERRRGAERPGDLSS